MRMLISNLGSKLTFSLWLLGVSTTQIKVCLELRLKNAKTLFLWIFWNFEISDKKSADFGCLFTFFQKYCKFMIISSTFWELHNCQLKLAICLHFGITTSVTDSIGHFIIFLKTLLIKVLIFIPRIYTELCWSFFKLWFLGTLSKMCLS